jgi:enamine deaminase RidA (YjgF/YER057c/UK114 family)
MTIKRIDPGPRLSKAVIYGNMVFLSGQMGAPGESIADQTRVVLAMIDDLLEEAGTNKSRLLNITIWLADIADFAAMNAVWDNWVDPKNTPARATSESKLATPDYKIEIIAVAALN